MNDKVYLIIGMARSGVAAAKLLADRGVTVRVNDMKTREALGEALKPLEGLKSIEWHLGEAPETLLHGVGTMVISPGIPYEADIVQTALSQGIEVIGEIELSARLNKGRLIAITGTNGKTTTTTLTGEIFKSAGLTTHVVGNIGYPFAAVAGTTGPDDVVVCEVSSFQLESVKTFRPSVACVTNVREDHLNRHHTMAVYAAMKARIFENQTPDDVLVLNAADAYAPAFAEASKGQVVWFSSQGKVPRGAYADGGLIYYESGHGRQTICRCDELLIPGQHNLENALCAVAITMSAGVPAEAAARALRSFKGIEHRMELVRVLDGVRYIDDTEGTNADSTVQAVRAMTEDTVLILGGSIKDNDYSGLCRDIATCGHIAHVVLIGQTAEQFDAALKKAGYDTARIHHLGRDFKGAIETARTLADRHGAVLLSPACASFDMFHNADERGDIFKDIVNHMTPSEA